MFLRRSLARFQSTLVTPNLLHLRVGQITAIEQHPSADKLFVSQVSLGGQESLQVCSGLVGLVQRETLLSRMVVVVCNLKPSKMRGVKSEGMLLCSEKVVGDSDEYRVMPICHPDGSQPGQELKFDGAEPVELKKRLKSKQWDAIVTGLRSNKDGNVVWRDENGKEFPLVADAAEELEPTPICKVEPGFNDCQVR